MRRAQSNAFTLLELVIVLSIILILTAIFMPNGIRVRSKADKAVKFHQENTDKCNEAMELPPKAKDTAHVPSEGSMRGV